MKYRLDFVTNSSSSSYICDVCGTIESGWDLCLSDAEMFQCRNNHIFHEDEAIGDPNEISKDSVISKLNGMIDFYKEKLNNYKDIEENKDKIVYIKKQINSIKEDLLRINKANEDEVEDIYNIISEYYDLYDRYSVDIKYCPICQMKYVSKNDMFEYLLKLVNLGTEKETEERIKKMFLNYNEFKEFFSKNREDK